MEKDTCHKLNNPKQEGTKGTKQLDRIVNILGYYQHANGSQKEKFKEGEIHALLVDGHGYYEKQINFLVNFNTNSYIPTEKHFIIPRELNVSLNSNSFYHSHL